MTVASISAAVDEMMAEVKTVWDTTGFPMDYPNVKPVVPLPPDTDTPWARTRVQHTEARQASLAGAQGARQWRRDGILRVQVFTPLGEGLVQGYDLAQLLVDHFQSLSTPGGIWFRNVGLTEGGEDGEWTQTLFRADFTYDEVK